MPDCVSIYKTLCLKEAALYGTQYNILWASGFRITENLLDRCLEIAEQRLGKKVKIIMGKDCPGASMDLFFPPRDDGHQRLSVETQKDPLLKYPLPKYNRTYWESVTVFEQLKDNMFFVAETSRNEYQSILRLVYNQYYNSGFLYSIGQNPPLSIMGTIDSFKDVGRMADQGMVRFNEPYKYCGEEANDVDF